MNQIFNNLRAILTKHKENLPVVTVAEMLAEIDEAEAKLGCHAICYLDSPCEYQNKDINVTNVDEYYKGTRAKAIDEFCTEAIKQFAEFDRLHGYPTVADCEDVLNDVAEQLKGE